MSTAAAVVIGDEILSGKVAEANTGRLIELLREAGVVLRRIAVIPDEVEAIAEEVARTAAAHTYVFTSGGVGPTHDDRTVEGVAGAFGVPVVRHPELEALVRGFWGERVNEAALRLADVPAGARLLRADDRLLPLVVARNVFLLPGVPRLFAAKLAGLRGELAGACVTVNSLYLLCEETEAADAMAAAERESAGVRIGSYPRGRDADHRVWVTLEGEDAGAVGRATDRLLELLPSRHVLRVQR